MVNGALSELLRPENFEQFGSVTPEEVADRFETMFFEFRDSECNVSIPPGATMIWHTNAPPTRWLLCTGGAVLKSEYPELYAVIGDKYGSTETQFGLPDMQSVSPFGAGGDVGLDDYNGALTHTLTTNEIPAHNHTILLRGSGTAGGTANRANAPTQTTLASNLATDAAGGGAAHNNLHPVFGVFFIIYGGKE